MKQGLKYILLIITVFSFGKIFSQSLITAKFVQIDSICENTAGTMRISMYDADTMKTQKVSCFKLMFEYDASLMRIENITPRNTILENFVASYPASGQCVIIDSLPIPINFYDSLQIGLVFEISFNGLQQGTGAVRFISDSCYFKTVEDENIAAVYRDSLDINVHPGFIEMTLAQIGWGCSYEDKGQAEVKITDGAPPYKYKWTDGMQNPSSPYQVGQLPEGEVGVRIIDVNGCLHDTTMMIESLRAPKIDWTYESTVMPDSYEPTPEFAVKEHPIRFYVTEFGDGYNWEWKIYYTNPDSNIRDSLDKDLGDRKNKTDFIYIFPVENDYEVQLTAQSLETGCDTVVIKTVKVEVAELKFNNLVTPGNNRFKIQANGKALRDVFVSHTLIIQDRTGRRVYDTKDFPDDGWDGGGCPNGTYYFILKAKSTRKEYKYQGTLVILGGNK